MRNRRLALLASLAFLTAACGSITSPDREAGQARFNSVGESASVPMDQTQSAASDTTGGGTSRGSGGFGSGH